MILNTLLYALLAIIAVSALVAFNGAQPRTSGRRALRWLLAGLAVSPVVNALPAIYQCELNGRVTYQGTPCEIDAITIRVMPILTPPPEVNRPAAFPQVEPAVVAVPVPAAAGKMLETAESKAPVAARGGGAPPAPLASERKAALDAPRPSVYPKTRIERVEQTPANRDKRAAEVRTASAECQGILGQLATQKEMLHSLRAETRTQAKAKVAELARDLQQRC